MKFSYSYSIIIDTYYLPFSSIISMISRYKYDIETVRKEDHYVTENYADLAIFTEFVSIVHYPCSMAN